MHLVHTQSKDIATSMHVHNDRKSGVGFGVGWPCDLQAQAVLAKYIEKSTTYNDKVEVHL